MFPLQYNFVLFYIKVLQNELRALNVEGDSWTITNDKQFHQVYIVPHKFIISSPVTVLTLFTLLFIR